MPRVEDSGCGRDVTWRIVYRLDADAVVILDVFNKTRQTPRSVIDTCKQRPRDYDAVAGREKKR